MDEKTSNELRAYFQACDVIAVVTGGCTDRVFVRNLFPDADTEQFKFLYDFQHLRDDIAAIVLGHEKGDDIDERETLWLEWREKLRADYPEPTKLQSFFIESATLNFTRPES